MLWSEMILDGVGCLLAGWLLASSIVSLPYFDGPW